MLYRIEKDFLGEKRIPQEAYWGIHTQRALETDHANLQRIRIKSI